MQIGQKLVENLSADTSVNTQKFVSEAVIWLTLKGTNRKDVSKVNLSQGVAKLLGQQGRFSMG